MSAMTKSRSRARDTGRALAERIKELHCLYTIGRLTDHRDFDLEEVLGRVVTIIPAAWQYTDVVCARLVVEGRSYQTPDYVETKWMQEAMVIAEGAMVGRLIVCYREKRPDADEGPFLNEERNLLNVLAQRVGEIVERQRAAQKLSVYQEQLRSLAWQITRTEERARRDIATVLHDRVGQTLASARINLVLALASDMPARPKDLLNETGTLLKQAIRDTRSLIFDISPPILYEVGLGGAVEWAAEQARKSYAFDIALESDPLPDLEDDAASAIFQACRELLNNVGRHARANHVEVKMSWDGDTLAIVVRDDGVGFDVAAAKERALKEGNYGIFSIRERFEHLGGSVHIDSATGHGTSVVLQYSPRSFGRREKREER